MRQQSSHPERQQDTHPARHDRGGALADEMFIFKFHSDQEEEQHQADGGEGFEGP